MNSPNLASSTATLISSFPFLNAATSAAGTRPGVQTDALADRPEGPRKKNMSLCPDVGDKSPGCNAIKDVRGAAFVQSMWRCRGESPARVQQLRLRPGL